MKIELTSTQEYAVKLMGFPILIVASAGSGKTRVIVEKIKYLLNLGIQKNRIVALTFTNKAADEIVKRISKTEKDFFPYFGTFHSFCLKILKENYSIFNINPNFSIIDDDDQFEIIKELYKKYIENNKIKKNYSLESIVEKINFIKLDKIEFDNNKIIYKKLNFENEKIIKEIFLEYEKVLRENNFFDFQDLLLFTLRGLKNENNHNIIKNYFDYILVDEYQDTNWIQKEILKYIYNGSNLLAVGDEDQAIYSFRGGDVNNILNFEKDFPNAKIIFMTENFRSGKNIINFANFIISKNKFRREKRLTSALNFDGEVCIWNLRSEEEEQAAIVSIIKKLINIGYKLNDIAILFRANWQSGIIEKALMDENIKYTLYGAISFFKRKEIKIAFDFISFILNPSSHYLLAKLINLNRIGIGEKKIGEFINFAFYNGYKNSDSLIPYLLIYEKNKEFKSFGEKIKILYEYFDSPVNFLIKLKEIFNLYETFKKIQYDSISPEEREENYEQLIFIAEEFSKKLPKATIKDFYEKFILYSREKIEKDNDTVKLMTIHLAKGLEFPVIIITDVINGILPYIRLKDINGTNIEEERRLFYVASTRAKEKLFILTYAQYSDLNNFAYTIKINNEIENPELIKYLENFKAPSLFLEGFDKLNFINFINSNENFKFKNTKLNYNDNNNNNNRNNNGKNNNEEEKDNNLKNGFINHKDYGILKIIKTTKISKNIVIYECLNAKGDLIKIIDKLI